ncbi:biopolymer transporter ExbD [Pseudoxanthomonas sp. CF125]|uniref:ExbD/TolR family protein n=1 Tax=Pseudoxanthomonas sp. CF125 TaxID=1855303 RepID=UPI0008917112|nr:biopolymer transporter ExbD [Pseudoxanthomonas sp. CF125]SDR13779.1 biopolymer transport protein TolR [Pseudoxanthomonas sp. CF125]
MAFSATARDSVVAEMNITPLVDVMLVLLVIFMVSAPLLTKTVDAGLPQVTSDDPETIKPLQLQLDIGDDGSYRLDGRLLPQSELGARLGDAALSDPRVVLRVHGSSGADYQQVVTVLAEARKQGIANLSVQH